MESTWRWFGPEDPIGIEDVAQTGVTGVVTALHHVPPGQVWEVQEIRKRISEVRSASDGTPTRLEWRVAESLVVSEAIKSGRGAVAEHLDAYCRSIENLGSEGVRIVAYNFMPILDWTRTSTEYKVGFSGRSMSFDYIDLAAFDLHVLQRHGAFDTYAIDIRERADRRFAAMTETEISELTSNIVAGFPGANQKLDIDELERQIELYREIDREAMLRNLDRFLNAVLPVAEKNDVKLCVHPDDPPFDVLGLPRILSSHSDFTALRSISDSPSNGITFCSGSLGAGVGFDAIEFIREFGSSIHFAHLRNTALDEDFDGVATSFHESGHIQGDTDMVGVVKALVNEERIGQQEGYRSEPIPMRPDHGISMLSDINAGLRAGYPLVGRLHGLAELRGIEAALRTKR